MKRNLLMAAVVAVLVVFSNTVAEQGPLADKVSANAKKLLADVHAAS
jgi:hypothetical protein